MEGKVDQIEELLRQGVTKKQLVAAGFSESTVRKAMKRLSANNPGSNASDNNTVNKQDTPSAAPNALPVKIGPKDMIPPEAALQHIRLQDGDYKKGFTDGMAVLILAARYNQILAGAQAEATESQLKILREVKSASDEVAQQAAQEAAAGVAAYFEREKPWLAASPNPMASMTVELMKPILQNMMGRFMPGVPGGHVDQSGAGFSPPPGFSYKEEEK